MKMICPNDHECKRCYHNGEHEVTEHCGDKDGDCPSCFSLKENNGLCPYCGKQLIGKPRGCLTCNYFKEEPMTNPSPQQIFAHIKTDCERRAFDEFMRWCGSGWLSTLTNSQLDYIKGNHPDWHRWLISKGLVEKKVVKKVLTGEVEWHKTIQGSLLFWDGVGTDRAESFASIMGKKGKLTFEYEEEE